MTIMSEETTVIESEAEVTEGNEEEVDQEQEQPWTEETVEAKLARIEQEKEELLEKNKNLYQKIKDWYKKGNKIKESVKEWFVSKDEVKNLIKEVQKESQQENDFVTKYDDAKDFLPEIRKVMDEDGISIDKAYALIKGKMMYDDGYKNQMMQSRTWNHGSITKNTTGTFRHIFEGKKK